MPENKLKLVITLEKDEYIALEKLSEQELRVPSIQVRFILRHDLEQRGLLPLVEQITSLQTGQGASS